MQNTNKLVRLNLQLRQDHLDRMTTIAATLAKRKGRDTRLAEALKLSLTAGLTWSDNDLLALVRPDRGEPCWLALGPIVRPR